MKLEKLEVQELDLDPAKTYIIDFHFSKDCKIETRFELFKQYKKEFEANGITNVIFNPYIDYCKLEVLEAEEK